MWCACVCVRVHTAQHAHCTHLLLPWRWSFVHAPPPYTVKAALTAQAKIRTEINRPVFKKLYLPLPTTGYEVKTTLMG